VLILTEHVSIIALAVTLFIAFSPYNKLLAVVWTISRTGESIIQIYNKKSYWRLLHIAKKYSAANNTEKRSLTDSGQSILKTKNSVFKFAQILFSIGTLTYSILFSTTGVVPEPLGGFGIVASVIYGLGNGVVLQKPNSKVLWSLGGLLILIFEIVLGGWLIASQFI
jgi:hypothetical protein